MKKSNYCLCFFYVRSLIFVHLILIFFLASFSKENFAIANGPECIPIEQIRARVQYCHENFSYMDPAKQCGDFYLEKAKRQIALAKKTIAGLNLSEAKNAQKKSAEVSCSPKVF